MNTFVLEQHSYLPICFLVLWSYDHMLCRGRKRHHLVVLLIIINVSHAFVGLERYGVASEALQAPCCFLLWVAADLITEILLSNWLKSDFILAFLYLKEEARSWARLPRIEKSPGLVPVQVFPRGVCVASLHPGSLPRAPVTLIGAKQRRAGNWGMKTPPGCSQWRSCGPTLLFLLWHDRRSPTEGGRKQHDEKRRRLNEIKTEIEPQINSSPQQSVKMQKVDLRVFFPRLRKRWRHLLNPRRSLVRTYSRLSRNNCCAKIFLLLLEINMGQQRCFLYRVYDARSIINYCH